MVKLMVWDSTRLRFIIYVYSCWREIRRSSQQYLWSHAKMRIGQVRGTSNANKICTFFSFNIYLDTHILCDDQQCTLASYLPPLYLFFCLYYLPILFNARYDPTTLSIEVLNSFCSHDMHIFNSSSAASPHTPYTNIYTVLYNTSYVLSI